MENYILKKEEANNNTWYCIINYLQDEPFRQMQLKLYLEERF